MVIFQFKICFSSIFFQLQLTLHRIMRFSILLGQLLIIFRLFRISSCQFGNNLIDNGDFSLPDIRSQGIYWTFFHGSIPGWNCTYQCELDNCKLENSFYVNILSIPFGDCEGQVLDISSDKIQAISQIFTAQPGNHLMEVKFLSPLPVSNIQLKIFLIFLNQKLIYSFQPQSLTSLPVHNFTAIVQLLQGQNNVTFTMAGLNDGCGFRLVSVSVRRIIDDKEEDLINSIFQNMAMEGLVGIPGVRFVLGMLMNAFISLDRLQLYYYHNRKYSHFSSLLLKNIANLLDSKGELTINAQRAAFGQLAKVEQSFLQSLDFKYSYINPQMLDKSQNGYSFISNNANLFIYSIPFYGITLLIFYLIFRLTFQDNLSKLFRKYSFFVTSFLMMICQGNIQQYSFYAFGQLSTFFTVNFKHKMVNIFILTFFYIVIFAAVALYFIFWSWYRRKVKYFAQNVTISIKGILFCTIDRGIICLILGALHSLLLPLPRLQLLLLGIIEVVWILLKLFGISYHVYQRSSLTWLSIVDGLNRIFFQLTIWIYSQSLGSARNSNFINSQIHLSQVYLLIGVWALISSTSLWIFIAELVALRHKSKQARIKKAFSTKLGTKRIKSNYNRAKKVIKSHQSVLLKQRSQVPKIKNEYHLIFRGGRLFMSTDK